MMISVGFSQMSEAPPLCVWSDHANLPRRGRKGKVINFQAHAKRRRYFYYEKGKEEVVQK